MLHVTTSPSVWLATQNHSTLVTETTVVPFLPVNPEYSSTRNQASDCINGSPCSNLTFIAAFYVLTLFSFLQGRQKLARFSAREFATLVIDILADAKRRLWGNSCDSPRGTKRRLPIFVLTHFQFPYSCIFVCFVCMCVTS